MGGWSNRRGTFHPLLPAQALPLTTPPMVPPPLARQRSDCVIQATFPCLLQPENVWLLAFGAALSATVVKVSNSLPSTPTYMRVGKLLTQRNQKNKTNFSNHTNKTSCQVPSPRSLDHQWLLCGVARQRQNSWQAHLLPLHRWSGNRFHQMPARRHLGRC